MKTITEETFERIKVARARLLDHVEVLAEEAEKALRGDSQ